MKTINKLTPVALALLSSTAMAQDVTNDSNFVIKPLVEMGLAFGGDEVGELKYENGDKVEVTSGGGVIIGGGFDVSFHDKPYGILLTAAYHGDSASASNADVSFDRYVLNAMPYIQLKDNVSFAAGLTFHNSVEYEFEFQGSETFEFDSASGLVAEFRYHSSEKLVFSGRVTLIEYDLTNYNGFQVNSSSSESLSGNNVGLFMSYSFSK